MKRILLLAALASTMLLSGCFGYTSTGNEVVGQVKKVIKHTPLMLPNYVSVDLSLGVMRNGTGSMSKEDLIMYVPDERLVSQLQALAESGEIIKVSYGVARYRFYVPNEELESMRLAK